MAVTYNDLYLDIRRILRENGVTSASLEAREIVSSAAEKDRDAFYRDMRLYASDTVEERARWLLKRRLGGEPLAYLIGEWEFYGVALDINSSVLIPRVDTEVLAGKAIERMKSVGLGGRMLDLCCGSGCVGLAVARNTLNCAVLRVDISEDAIHLAKQNIRRNLLGSRVVAMAADAKKEPLPNLGSFDLIACNPPYIANGEIAGLDPSVRDYEPHLALVGGEDGLDFYREICVNWRQALKPGGSLMFECGMGQAEMVASIMEKASFKIKEIVKDTGGIDRVVSGYIQ